MHTAGTTQIPVSWSSSCTPSSSQASLEGQGVLYPLLLGLLEPPRGTALAWPEGPPLPRDHWEPALSCLPRTFFSIQKWLPLHYLPFSPGDGVATLALGISEML